jgi:hypothetical protein
VLRVCMYVCMYVCAVGLSSPCENEYNGCNGVMGVMDGRACDSECMRNVVWPRYSRRIYASSWWCEGNVCTHLDVHLGSIRHFLHAYLLQPTVGISSDHSRT